MGDHTPDQVPPGNPGELEKTEQAVGYISRWFVQALFPYRKTDELVRQVQSGRDRATVMSANGLPYGKYPRLIMAAIITTAVQRAGQVQLGLMTPEEARRIPLGRSLDGFLAAIGITSRGTGGARGNRTMIREQIRRLTSSIITVQKIYETRDQGVNAPVARRWDLWFDPANPGQETITESYIELTEEFWEQINRAPIPIDLDILKGLGRPRAMDLYVWISLKKYWLNKRSETEFTFAWEDLTEQFSPKKLKTPDDRMNFRKELRKALNDVTELWPAVGVEAVAGGLLVREGAPSVKIRPARQIEL